MLQERATEPIANQLGHALSHELITMQRLPQSLQPFVVHPDPLIAYLALEMGEFMVDIQEDFLDWNLLPLVIQAAFHPHWLVRYKAASLLPVKAPIRVYLHLLSDPEPAVVGKATENLLYLDPDRVFKMFHRLPPLNQGFIYYILKKWTQVNECFDQERPAAELLCTTLGQIEEVVYQWQSIDSWLWDQLGTPDWSRVPAETLALATTGFFAPDRMEAGLEVLETIIHKHPDPIAKFIALEWFQGWISDEYERFLLQIATHEHPTLQVKALQQLHCKISADNYAHIGAPVLELTFHPCLPVVQMATRALKEATDTFNPPKPLIDRLLALVKHPDPLVRVNALYSLRDYYVAPQETQEYLLQCWREEQISRVKVEIASTLWWWMDAADWWSLLGSWLWDFERGRWRRFAKSLISIWREDAIEKALPVVRIPSVRRCLRRRLHHLRNI